MIFLQSDAGNSTVNSVLLNCLSELLIVDTGQRLRNDTRNARVAGADRDKFRAVCKEDVRNRGRDDAGVLERACRSVGFCLTRIPTDCS